MKRQEIERMAKEGVPVTKLQIAEPLNSYYPS
jgi:hypothetical protein